MRHDFSVSMTLALSDYRLLRQLNNHLATGKLLAESESPLIAGTCSVANYALAKARSRYTSKPERLKCVISASSKVNALAVWGVAQNDWIVLSSGLLERLRETSVATFQHILDDWSILETQLGRSLAAQAPLGGFESPFAAMLYVSAVSFFIGHEAGHHLEGHDGYYQVGAVAELLDGEATGSERQSLEFFADAHGVSMSRQITTAFLLEVVDVRNFSVAERTEFQKVLAMLISLGIFLSISALDPRSVDLASIQSRSHPPSSVRALWISSLLTDAIKGAFHNLQVKDLRRIRLQALEWAAEASITPGTDAARIYEAREAAAEPRALRAVGIRRALYDPNLRAYLRSIREIGKLLRPRLRPRYVE